MFAMVCPDINIAFLQSSKNMKEKTFLVDYEIRHKQILRYINIRTNHGRYWSKISAMVCPDIDRAFFQSSKNMKKKFLEYFEITHKQISC